MSLNIDIETNEQRRGVKEFYDPIKILSGTSRRSVHSDYEIEVSRENHGFDKQTDKLF